MPQRPTICDAAYRRLFFASTLALVLSAALMILGFFLIAPSLHPKLKGINLADSTPAAILEGNTFRPILGKVTGFPDHIEITELEGDRALLAKSIVRKADDYPFVEVRVDCNHPGLTINFFWRNSVDAKKISEAPIALSGGGSATILLHGDRDWLADITEIGVDIYGDLRDCPLRVVSVSLLPYSAATLLSAVSSEWTAFNVWDQTSINAYRGVPRNPILYPALTVACWLILSFLICGAFCFIPNLIASRNEQQAVGPALRLIIIAIIIGTVGWLSLDALWLYKNTLQAGETRYRFAGKTLHEKKLNDWDSSVYAFAEQIKSKRLVPEGEIIELYYEEEEKATTGRLRYHLLPEYRLKGVKKPVTQHLDLLTGPEKYFIVLSSGKSFGGKNRGRHADSETGKLLQRLYTNDRLALYKRRKLETIEEAKR